MEQIAFIGTGIMGRSMAAHILEAGYPLIVYNRSREKAAELIERGAQWAASPGEAASKADVLISMVGYPRDVEEIYLAPEGSAGGPAGGSAGGHAGDSASGIIEGARPGTLLIDMTTSSPALARRIAEKAAAAGMASLDAPVSGGDLGARNATLSIMAGGEEAAFNRALPLFRLMGKNIVLQGGPGAGQHCKMCNQIAIAASMLAVTEALIYGLKAGLDPQTMLKSIEAGAAGSWSLSNLAPRMLKGDFKPGFFVKHFIKDINIALDSADEMRLKLPGLELARQLYTILAGTDRGKLEEAVHAAASLGKPGSIENAVFDPALSGAEDLGTQAIFLLYAAGQYEA
jgi:3-hydroxyisobutyrate dehydrogenase